jgi:hypothetical protein
MNFPPPDSQFQPQGYSNWFPFSPPDVGYAAAEGIPPANDTQWGPIPSYEQGSFLSASVVQAHGNATTFHIDDHFSSRIALPLQFDPADTITQSPQMLPPNSTNATNVQTMAPPPNPRKRKAPTLLLHDWEPVKARLIELHIVKKIPLPKVKKILEEEFKSSGFSAT